MKLIKMHVKSKPDIIAHEQQCGRENGCMDGLTKVIATMIAHEQ